MDAVVDGWAEHQGRSRHRHDARSTAANIPLRDGDGERVTVPSAAAEAI